MSHICDTGIIWINAPTRDENNVFYSADRITGTLLSKVKKSGCQKEKTFL